MSETRGAALQVSVVIPTYNEAANVAPMAAAIGRALGGVAYEVVFVDDSTDETPDALARLAEADARVRVEHRERERGLGTAVVRGIALARGRVIAVMDADFQHPPELLPALLDAVESGAELVIPSRFVAGGDDGGLPPLRKLVSAVARAVGKLAVKRLRQVSDPTGGYFMFRREVVAGVELRPVGWKILIEVLVRGHYNSIAEIPYCFQPRQAGASKLSPREEWNYLRHLFVLTKSSPEDRRFFLFALVGVSGILVNMLAYALIVRAGVAVAAAGVGSGLVAMLWNFTLNDGITWREARRGALAARGLKYLAVTLAGTGLSVAVLSGLFYRLHLHYLLANLAGILAAMLWNYRANSLWTWRSAPSLGRASIRRLVPSELSSAGD